MKLKMNQSGRRLPGTTRAISLSSEERDFRSTRKFAPKLFVDSDTKASVTQIPDKRKKRTTSTPSNVFSKIPAVDDLINYLCFRETCVFPAKLDYMSSRRFDISLDSEKLNETSSDDMLPSDSTSTSRTNVKRMQLHCTRKQRKKCQNCGRLTIKDNQICRLCDSNLNTEKATVSQTTRTRKKKMISCVASVANETNPRTSTSKVLTISSQDCNMNSVTNRVVAKTDYVSEVQLAKKLNTPTGSESPERKQISSSDSLRPVVILRLGLNKKGDRGKKLNRLPNEFQLTGHPKLENNTSRIR